MSTAYRILASVLAAIIVTLSACRLIFEKFDLDAIAIAVLAVGWWMASWMASE